MCFCHCKVWGAAPVTSVCVCVREAMKPFIWRSWFCEIYKLIFPPKSPRLSWDLNIREMAELRDEAPRVDGPLMAASRRNTAPWRPDTPFGRSAFRRRAALKFDCALLPPGGIRRKCVVEGIFISCLSRKAAARGTMCLCCFLRMDLFCHMTSLLFIDQGVWTVGGGGDVRLVASS